MNQHYGLPYDHTGWHIADPNPWPGYPLTQVCDLQHGDATYNITWQGTGQVQRVVVNGDTMPDAHLGWRDGVYDVLVELGT